MSFNCNLNDKDYYNYVTNYHSLIDEQRKQHRSTYFPHIFRPNSLQKELQEQSEKDHLRQIRLEETNRGSEGYSKELQQLKQRFASRYPKYHSP